MLAVKNGLREETFTINEEKFYSKQVNIVSFMGYPILKEGIAPYAKHVEKVKNAETITNNNKSNHLSG